MNIICVVTDTLRADHLPTYGNQQVIAPILDGNSRPKRIVFEDCHAASFPTVPTRADIATGRLHLHLSDLGTAAARRDHAGGLALTKVGLHHDGHRRYALPHPQRLWLRPRL